MPTPRRPRLLLVDDQMDVARGRARLPEDEADTIVVGSLGREARDQEEERIAATGVRRLSKPISVAGVRVLLGLR